MYILTNGQSHHFFQTLSVVGHCVSVNQFTGRQKSEWLYFLLSPIVQEWIMGTGNCPRKMKYNKMESAITLKVKWKSNIPGIIEGRTDHGNVDIDTFQEPPNR